MRPTGDDVVGVRILVRILPSNPMSLAVLVCLAFACMTQQFCTVHAFKRLTNFPTNSLPKALPRGLGCPTMARTASDKASLVVGGGHAGSLAVSKSPPWMPCPPLASQGSREDLAPIVGALQKSQLPMHQQTKSYAINKLGSKSLHVCGVCHIWRT